MSNKIAKKATNSDVDSFLKGSNQQEHIIKIECGYDDAQATVIWRDDDFKKHYDKEDFFPFCWAKTAAARSLFKGDRTKLILAMQDYGIWCKGLCTTSMDGVEPERMKNGYNVLFYATKPMSNKRFSDFFEKANVPLRPKERHWSYGKNYYKTCAPNEQFMIATGKRLFKGYESYNDILRMQFDIETSGLDAKTDTLDQIGVRTNKGFEKIITVTGDTPEEYYRNAYQAMNEFYDIIAKEDPDVVSGYNSENFDWNFFNVFGTTHYEEDLLQMSKRKGLENGVYKKTKTSVLKLGGEMEYYYPTVMWGKHITDCLFSVRRAQALDSNMKKATLKYVTKYSKINKKNRVYVPGKIINETWSDNSNTYAFNDNNGKWFKVDDNVLAKHFIIRNEIGSHIEEKLVDDELIIENEAEYNSLNIVDGFFIDNVGNKCKITNINKNDNILHGIYMIISYTYLKSETVTDYEEIDGGLKYTISDQIIIDNENGDKYELKSGRYIVQRYLLDDLWETDKVEERYNESNFLVGKMLPVNFERMCTMGTATIWKYIMMAWSYENDLAIPLETSSRSFTGGLSRLLKVGYIAKVQKLDFNSLYPSIILSFGIKSPIDISGAMPAMLEYILTQREYFKGLKGKYGKEAKSLGKEIENLIISGADEIVLSSMRTKQQEASALSSRNDKMQLPLKITGNAYFGSFGSGGGVFPWSDIDCAEETTCCGRQMLRLMLKWFTDLGYEGIVCDTDGMNFKQPNEFRYTDENPYISTGLNRNTEKGKKYIGPWADLAEFNDLFMRVKNGLDIDEFVPSSCYVARKNYMDLLDVEKQEIKLVGNTLKSKKMPIYIEKFIDNSVRDLLNDRGYEYLEKYYDKIEDIYNLRIPIKDIATVGKIKVSLDEYKASCKERTKSGNKKSRQAWYELAIKNNLDVHMGDTIYYINTGTKKSDSDVQRITHYYDTIDGKRTEVTKVYSKEYETLKKIIKKGSDTEKKEAKDKLTYICDGKEKTMNLELYIKNYHPTAYDEDELIFNCVLIPANIVEDEEDHYCDDEFTYNVEKYINMFNNRIKPQMVVFDESIRDKYTTKKKKTKIDGKDVMVDVINKEHNIIVNNPKDRKYFTRTQTKLVSGQPYNASDQDTYEELMTMEDKEIKFWISKDKEPVYWRECGMDWSSIKKEYIERMEVLKKDGIKQEVDKYNAIISKLTNKDVDDLLNDGIIPDSILSFCEFDAKTGGFVSNEWKIKIGSIYDILDYQDDKHIYEDDTEFSDM